MNQKEKRIVVTSVVLLVTALFLFILFSFYFSWDFLVASGDIVFDQNEPVVTEDSVIESSPHTDTTAFVPLGALAPHNSVNNSQDNFSRGRVGGGGSSGGNSDVVISERGPTRERGNIRLVSPFSRVLLSEERSDFEFVIDDTLVYSHCDLNLDGAMVQSFNFPEKNRSIHYDVANLSVGVHFWNVRCVNENLSELASETKRFIVFLSTHYGGRTTDLSSLENVEHVIHFTLEHQQRGLIVFDDAVNLSRGINFDDFVHIDHNFIHINSELVPELNTSATLTFFGLDIDHPVILRDGEVCDDCELVASDEGISFHVNHFSSYTVSGNAALHLFDSTDSATKYVSDPVFFFANYTNLTSGQSINGSLMYCNITFPDGFAGNMTYNATSHLYEYNKTFSQSGTFLFFVSCYGQPAGFSNVNSNDTFTILLMQTTGVSGANITVVRSETASSTSPTNDSAVAGNITELLITGYSTTQSWQGYIGNVSGAIRLADASGDVLYNWSLAEPEGEVYATTSSVVSWSNIQCFNFTARGTYGDESGQGGSTNLNGTNLPILETLYGLDSLDVDGVDETFNLKGAGTHDAFFTASTSFSEGECPNTRVFDSSGKGQSNSFEEVLLYEPVSASVVFTALLEKGTLLGYDSLDHDFEMLVLENGNAGNSVSTPYYFFVELG